MYCKFEYTGKVFNNTKIYKCNVCELEVALENPDINIICFKEAKDIFNQFRAGDDQAIRPENIFGDQYEANSFISQQASQSLSNKSLQSEPYNPQDRLCTDSQIQERLAICRPCKYYQDDSCTLCGCVIVREKNYMNKLANKNAKCPDNKWGPIN